MPLRIYGAEETEAAKRPRRKPSEIVRCRCGCGNPARWPRDGRPVFYTRLCGYRVAVRMFRRKAR